MLKDLNQCAILNKENAPGRFQVSSWGVFAFKERVLYLIALFPHGFGTSPALTGRYIALVDGGRGYAYDISPSHRSTVL